MILDLIFSAMAVAGVSALWRNFRYDTDNPANKYLNKLPYILKKPITCGICFTFWAAGVFNIFFVPLLGWLPLQRFSLEIPLAEFFVSWMVLGTASALILYILDTFFEVSHFYKHKAHTHQGHE